jgi:N6-adenosine-specific RNA methylase IME4
MSNYPNMSYCMNGNTLLALRQVVEAMNEEGPQFLREMSREERRAFEELFSMCEDFMSLSEELQEEFEREERDGQPDEAQEWADFDPDC